LSSERFKAVVDTNFYGVVNVTRAAVPIMRMQKSGCILQISSVGGRLTRPGSTPYHAAKSEAEATRAAEAVQWRELSSSTDVDTTTALPVCGFDSGMTPEITDTAQPRGTAFAVIPSLATSSAGASPARGVKSVIRLLS
jgi:NAD(P)-dependent dehydrogenase (short-subunit alcohol dehydrogenase family)